MRSDWCTEDGIFNIVHTDRPIHSIAFKFYSVNAAEACHSALSYLDNRKLRMPHIDMAFFGYFLFP